MSSIETRCQAKWAAVLALALACAHPADARDMNRPGLAPTGGFAALADLTLASKAVIAGRVRSVVRVPRSATQDLEPGARRYLVRVDVTRAILAPGEIPARIEYLWDAQSPRRPAIDSADVLVFLVPVPGKADQFRLVSAGAQIADTAETEATVRKLAAEGRDPKLAGRRVTGVSKAFTVPGSVPGEAETQIFLKTTGSEPISLVVISRPGEAKRYSAAFGDTIDESAGPVKPGTLAWYDLACGLPRTLPDDAVAELDEGQKATVAADYAFILKAIGKCGAAPVNDASSQPTDATSG